MDVNFSNVYSIHALKIDETNKETRKEHNIMINYFLAVVGLLLGFFTLFIVLYIKKTRVMKFIIPYRGCVVMMIGALMIIIQVTNLFPDYFPNGNALFIIPIIFILIGIYYQFKDNKSGRGYKK
ncbi:hypothetical protein R5R51_02345 [Oenococcus oeni]|uniref:Uncharacterized protein n=5 Tax=Oenococcus oeni TaxID=1247 RepID=A0NKX7_OENOE|nr:hypothetical protein [Oenococcus oeni]EAV38845.1 hypothetical protein OENOO_65047 [Oenococcus oeni ATCC BAA-1163]KGH71434.1 hypothetical protein X280_08795 [Oenococcus oeni IOEB_0502]KDP19392.1 hypothetical protein EL27_06120 [Oenococcus oeni]KGH58484.1 hypothetical protein X288_07415 [Oenococcus oeni IOEB_9805]KGH63606.1 hypothetical protein X375_01915 [Oenococcus oeni S13]